MKPDETVEYNSLSWVKKQLDAVLNDAQSALSDHINNTDDTAPMQQCVDHLRLVYGTLQMVEAYGAAMLAEEMEQTARAYLEGRADKADDVFDVLMRAMLQLPDYLEGLLSGNKDTPITLMPLMNDLRAARKENLLSEGGMFLPDVDTVEIETIEVDADVQAGKLLEEARRLRTHYQLGLLDYLKKSRATTGLKRMLAVIGSLEKVSLESSVRKFWMVVSGLIEGMLDEGIDANISVKMLLGAVDRQIKLLIDVGEEEFVDSYSQELLKNILYYVGRSKSEGPRVTKIKQAYRLDELLPSESPATGMGIGMGGMNAELFETVSRGIKEDLAQVKDTLEIFVHSADRDVQQLQPLHDQLGKIADTYGMLGLGAARQRVNDQRDVIDQFINGSREATQDSVMEIAGELLGAESELNDYIAQKAGIVDSSEDIDEDRVVPAAEYRQVISTVIKEGLGNFTEAKEAILSYVSGVGDNDQLDIILRRLDEVHGVTLMMSMKKIEKQIMHLMDYVRIALKGHHRQPDSDEQDTVADVVTSVEYFLEAVAEGRPGVAQGLIAGDEAAARLAAITEQYGDVEPEPVQGESAQAEAEHERPAEEKATVVARKVERVQENYDGYQIIGDDADEEIVEIFIEEAIEVLEELNTNFPNWKADNDDDEALTVIRRNFHTLKGSGRLIGAELIGEFAWKFENMLNRVIDKIIPVDNLLIAKVEEALTVLPQLIEQLKGNREPVQNVSELMNAADAISEGLSPDDIKKAGSSGTASAKKSAETAFEDELAVETTDEVGEEISLESIDDASVDELEAELESMETATDGAAGDDEDTISLSEQDGDEDSIDISELDIGSELSETGEEISLSVDELSGQPADEIEIASGDERDLDVIDLDLEAEETIDITDTEQEPEAGMGMDPLLFKIYYDESNNHLNMLGRLLEAHESGEKPLQADKELTRIFHTLHGSARTAGVEPISELCGAAEKYLKELQLMSDTVVPDPAVEIISSMKQSVGAMLDEIKSGATPQTNASLLEQIQQLLSEVSEQQLETGPEQNWTELAGHEQAAVTVSEAEEDEPKEAIISYSDIDSDLIDIFIEEADELLESCEVCLININEDVEDSDSIHQLQRHMHTLKGGARMADLTPIGDLTHALESLVIAVVEDKVNADKALFNLLHDSLDVLNGMLANVKKREAIKQAGQLLRKIETLMHGGIPEELPDDAVLTSAFDEQNKTYAKTPKSGETKDSVIIDLGKEYESKVKQAERETDAVASAETETGSQWGERAADVNKDPQEQVRVRADLLNNLVNFAGEVNIYHARMGKQITDIGFNLAELEQTVVRLREQLRKLEIETEIQIRSSYAKEADHYDADFDPLEMDRYSTLQQLTRSLGETANDVESINGIIADIVRDSETLLLQESRVSTELQEGLMRTRMVRFGGLATRLRRIVRQTARELGKDVELNLVGETNEVDRTVLDRIVAPLEHMLRNAVAHGIESSEARKKAGKSEVGSITVTVDRQGTDVLIIVEDDGAGINAKAVREKAIKQGLLDRDNTLSDRDVLQFILRTGFSTADKVTQVSGRGVGMDVVDSEIKQLGGMLEIDTTPGRGTQFIIRLPLTLAINHALLVNAGEEVYAIPLASIEGVARVTGDDLQKFYDSGEQQYVFNGIKYELRHLGNLLTGIQPDYSDQHELFPVILARVGEQNFALHVDSLVGRREIVVKPVGMQIATARGIAGATILADGRVVLILEMPSLVIGDAVIKEIDKKAEEPRKAEPETTTIMVVDDSITIRKVTARMLERNGMNVVTAKDGVDATNILQDQIPDLMLLDIEMPRMDGFELASYIRNDERLKNIPIIMITSRTGAKHKEKAMEIGVNDYLGKPYQEEELLKNINSLLEAAN